MIKYGRAGGIRTPTSDFGDRGSTVETTALIVLGRSNRSIKPWLDLAN